MSDHLLRFIEAQQTDFPNALAEVKNGKKWGCWMWTVFPQLRGLGYSERSHYFGIEDIHEARAYIQHPVLGSRLRQITQALLEQSESNARLIFGSPDDLKLHACMTLFSTIDQQEDKLFERAIERFFHAAPHKETLSLLYKQ